MIRYNFDPLLTKKKIDELILEPLIVSVSGTFDEEMLEDFEEDMQDAINTNQPVIPVIIDSLGGAVYSLLGMIDIIKNSPVPVATIVKAKAMSCGAILAGFGSPGYRFAGPLSTFMIHDVSHFTMGKLEEIKVDAAEADRLNKLIFQSLAVHLGHSKDYFLKFIHEKAHADWFLDAKEAKKHNLINHIKIPQMTVDINVKMSFE
jgi:ATP-dependent protease ClpP protease subunit